MLPGRNRIMLIEIRPVDLSYDYCSTIQMMVHIESKAGIRGYLRVPQLIHSVDYQGLQLKNLLGIYLGYLCQIRSQLRSATCWYLHKSQNASAIVV